MEEREGSGRRGPGPRRARNKVPATSGGEGLLSLQLVARSVVSRIVADSVSYDMSAKRFLEKGLEFHRKKFISLESDSCVIPS